MKVEVVTAEDRLAALEPAWAELADAADGSLYTSPLWAMTWWRHLRRGSLAVRVVHDSAGLVAVLPLHARRRGGRELLRGFGSDIGAVSSLLTAPDRPDVAARCWEAVVAGGDRVFDSHRHVAGAGAGGLEALWRAEDVHWSADVVGVCPVIAAPDGYDELIRTRGSRLRRTLTRAPRLAAEDGVDAESVVLTDRADVERVLPDLQVVWDAAEAADPRAHFLAGGLREFTLDLLRRAAQEDRLAVGLTRFGGEPAASAFAYRVGTGWSYSGPRFDPRFSRYAPGHLTLDALARHVLGRGGRFDLLLGGQDYKWQWSTTSYDVAHLTVAASARDLRRARAALRAVEWTQRQMWPLQQRLRRR